MMKEWRTWRHKWTVQSLGCKSDSPVSCFKISQSVGGTESPPLSNWSKCQYGNYCNCWVGYLLQHDVLLFWCSYVIENIS